MMDTATGKTKTFLSFFSTAGHFARLVLAMLVLSMPVLGVRPALVSVQAAAAPSTAPAMMEKVWAARRIRTGRCLNLLLDPSHTPYAACIEWGNSSKAAICLNDR